MTKFEQKIFSVQLDGIRAKYWPLCYAEKVIRLNGPGIEPYERIEHCTKDLGHGGKHSWEGG